MKRWRRFAPLLGAACGSAFAAGGHHSVDDATIADPGQCLVEVWGSRLQHGERSAHVGPACRAGPVELSANLDGTHDGTWSRATSVQAKAVQSLNDAWAVGASVSPFWRPQVRGTGVQLIATWAVDPWAAHFNLGRDWVRGGPGQAHSGASVEYMLTPKWQAVLERYVEQGTHSARAGLRYTVNDAWNVDFSRAVALRGPGGSSWTVGSAWTFSR